MQLVENILWIEIKAYLRNLFIESLTRESYSKENDLSTISLLEYFPKNYCFTFTLLHPENEIVYLLDYPMLYLSAVYDINRQSNKVINIPSFVFQTWDFFTKYDHFVSMYPSNVFFMGRSSN